ncbi:Tyrosinase-like protein orsC [Apiospora hydei]|uniref:Tyrosinase-like protein orsC n=1 Tax=Apiospora hydei TaxID=1337664 RepID=A0ABR1WYJ1_9PEZI
MTAVERKAYTKAVNCLLNKPSKYDPNVVPGAKSRYDDFVAQHINQTMSIHGTGNFLSWHRYFVWSYETALKEECHYEGYQPRERCRKHLPSLRQGGGCITSGPFKNMTVNLGPVSPAMDGETKVPSTFAWNPRCLKRDLSAYTAGKWLTPTNLLNITTGPAASTIETFQDELQGRFADKFLGMHAAGHFALGGDAGDLYSSSADPIFYLHHAMLDRVWWMWQALHLPQAFTVAGTITILNRPPSRNTTLEDPIYMGQSNAPERPISQLLNTLGGEPLCYIYL